MFLTSVALSLAVASAAIEPHEIGVNWMSLYNRPTDRVRDLVVVPGTNSVVRIFDENREPDRPGFKYLTDPECGEFVRRILMSGTRYFDLYLVFSGGKWYARDGGQYQFAVYIQELLQVISIFTQSTNEVVFVSFQSDDSVDPSRFGSFLKRHFYGRIFRNPGDGVALQDLLLDDIRGQIVLITNFDLPDYSYDAETEISFARLLESPKPENVIKNYIRAPGDPVSLPEQWRGLKLDSHYALGGQESGTSGAQCKSCQLAYRVLTDAYIVPRVVALFPANFPHLGVIINNFSSTYVNNALLLYILKFQGARMPPAPRRLAPPPSRSMTNDGDELTAYVAERRDERGNSLSLRVSGMPGFNPSRAGFPSDFFRRENPRHSEPLRFTGPQDYPYDPRMVGRGGPYPPNAYPGQGRGFF